nr:ABC transporter ATP-binding protein [Saccharopolyspora sp. HNM0983]
MHVSPGSTLGLLGPNGSGKSSLLRLLAGLRRPESGSVLVEDTDIGSWHSSDLAKQIAVVEQESSTELDVTVRDVVLLGRTPHRNGWGRPRAHDEAAVAEALDHARLTDLAERGWHSLSGGERQRTQIARALAQQPSELLLDEPTNHLDIAHQLELLALIRRLPVTSIVALHDLNLAAAFCDRVLVLSAGRVVEAGEPAEVLTPELVGDVYGVSCEVTKVPPEGRAHIRFLPERIR